MNNAVRRIFFTVVMLVGLVTVDSAFARGARVINDSDRTVLRGNVHPLAREESDAGSTDFSLPMERMVIALQPSPDKQAALSQFLAAQHDPNSADFHHWLTPEEFGERFGAAPEDVAAVTGWLTSQGFTVREVGKARTWINFSGAVSGVERAFRTQIHDYNVNGKTFHGNAVDPSIPRALADVVSGVVSLHNFPRKPMNTGARPLTKEELLPEYTTSRGSHYMAPGDFATIYNVASLYSAGINGTGQSIAIAGRTHPSSTNWSTFRSSMGLPANPPQVIVNGADPGDLGADEDGEADLDVEWSGAVAPNATIKFVISASTTTTDGVDLSAQYIVNNNIAPVMSVSFGSCEAQMGTAENQFFNNLWSQAAAQGITVFVAAGDSGAAGCSSSSSLSGSGQGVNGIASTPYSIAVGGTEFSEGSGTYWNPGNGTGDTSAIGYIPEVSWNESGNVTGGTELWATGGGVSIVYSKPSWQVSPGVPADGMRDVPDVSLSAAGHDAYLVQTQGSLSAVGGTSAASPSFAGLMALIVQKTGQRQGNANPRFYQLANAQYGSGGTSVFHDIVSGSNSVPGVTGFSSGVGYDSATGLGSVDATALASNWAASAATQIVNGACGSSNGQVLTAAPTSGFCSAGTASAVSGSGPWSWSCVGTGGGSTASCSASIQTHVVTPSAGVGGSISPSSPQTVAYNGTVGFTVTPATGYSIGPVSGCSGTLSGSIYTTGPIIADCSVTAAFNPIQYTVTFVAGANGGVSASSTSGAIVSQIAQTVTYGGSTQAVTAVPAAGYQFVGWTGSNGFTSTANPLTLTNITASQTLTATFIPEVWTVKPTALFPSYKETKGSIALTVASTASSTTISATTDASWITLTGSGTAIILKKGKGSGKLTYDIQANPSSAPRNGTITINGQQVSVSQAGAPCVVSSILPSRGTFPSEGGGLTFSVTAPDSCDWTVTIPTAAAAWLSSDTASGSGSGNITLTAATNIGADNAKGVYVKAKSRSASVTIVTTKPAKKSFSVSQSGS